MKITNDGATLGISNASPANDFVFRGGVVSAKKGIVSFSGEEKKTGIVVHGSGTGSASGDIGLMTLTLGTEHGNEPGWAGTELLFKKRAKESRLARLVAAEQHAIQMINDTSDSAPGASPRQ